MLKLLISIFTVWKNIKVFLKILKYRVFTFRISFYIHGNKVLSPYAHNIADDNPLLSRM